MHIHVGADASNIHMAPSQWSSRAHALRGPHQYQLDDNATDTYTVFGDREKDNGGHRHPAARDTSDTPLYDRHVSRTSSRQRRTRHSPSKTGHTCRKTATFKYADVGTLDTHGGSYINWKNGKRLTCRLSPPRRFMQPTKDRHRARSRFPRPPAASTLNVTATPPGRGGGGGGRRRRLATSTPRPSRTTFVG
jgi:hypothetical protein